MLVAYARTMIAQETQRGCQLTIVGDTDACFTISSQVFTAVEAKAADIAETSYSPPPVGGSMRLGSILDHAQPMSLGELQHRLHFDRITIYMDRNDSSSMRS